MLWWALGVTLSLMWLIRLYAELVDRRINNPLDLTASYGTQKEKCGDRKTVRRKT